MTYYASDGQLVGPPLKQVSDNKCTPSNSEYSHQTASTHITVWVLTSLYGYSHHCTGTHITVRVLTSNSEYSHHCTGTHITVRVLPSLYGYSHHCTGTHITVRGLLGGQALAAAIALQAPVQRRLARWGGRLVHNQNAMRYTHFANVTPENK